LVKVVYASARNIACKPCDIVHLFVIIWGLFPYLLASITWQLTQCRSLFCLWSD